MNFDPVKYVKETTSHEGYICEMNFDPLARQNICSSYSLTMFSKFSLIHFQVICKMNFDPFFSVETIIGTQVKQSSFFEYGRIELLLELNRH